jgi:hypothetical protein
MVSRKASNKLKIDGRAIASEPVILFESRVESGLGA